MTNPLLTAIDLPSFAAIQPEHVEPAIDHLLTANRAAIELNCPIFPRSFLVKSMKSIN